MKTLIKKIKRFFSTKHSDILIISGKDYDLQYKYKHLIERRDIKITSISISKHFEKYGRKEHLIMVISYDYYN